MELLASLAYWLKTEWDEASRFHPCQSFEECFGARLKALVKRLWAMFVARLIVHVRSHLASRLRALDNPIHDLHVPSMTAAQRSRAFLLTVCTLGVSAASAAAQVHLGDSVPKVALLQPLPADSVYEGAREVVRAETRYVSAMRVRRSRRGGRAGTVVRREMFLVAHARAGRGPGVFDRVTAALRVDSLFVVVYVGEIDPGLGFADRFEVVAPPRDGLPVPLLHVRFAQTGSGGVTEDQLYALGPADRLVEVPIVHPDLSTRLEDGEHLCCGSFTVFDDRLIEWTSYVTRGAAADATHRLRTAYRLDGRYRFDEQTGEYVPQFQLVAVETGGREPVTSEG